MRQKLISSIILFSLLLAAVPALAQERERSTGQYFMPNPPAKKVREAMGTGESQNATTSSSRKASTTERRMEKREDMRERKASTTERRIEMQQGLAKRKAEQAARVLAATIERLEKIVSRIESRVEKLKASGSETGEAETFVAEAKTHLSEARKSLEKFSSISITADRARENFEAVKLAAAEVKMHIREAHRSMKNAVRALKGERPESELEVEN
jgi:exonuclease VII small subunit